MFVKPYLLKRFAFSVGDLPSQLAMPPKRVVKRERLAAARTRTAEKNRRRKERHQALVAMNNLAVGIGIAAPKLCLKATLPEIATFVAALRRRSRGGPAR